VVLRQGLVADQVSLGGGSNTIFMGRQGSGGRLNLGSERNQLVIGLGTLDPSAIPSADQVSGFDPAKDRILVVGDAQMAIQSTSEGIQLSLDGRPVLLLSNGVDQGVLQAAINRDQPGNGDLIARIKARGVLSVALPENRPGISKRDPYGLWSGVAVDLVRAIAEQLLGSPERVIFADPSADGGVREALRSGSIDIALLTGDPAAADLAGDGDRSWTVPAATPDGDLTFLLPQNETIFRQVVNRILQAPLQAELLGLSAAKLPTATSATLSAEQLRLLDLQATGQDSIAGVGTPLQRGFVGRILNRLGNAAELFNRFFPSAERPIPVIDHPLDLPVDGPALQVATTTAPAAGDGLAAIAARGTLRVGFAGPGEANLLDWQRELLASLTTGLAQGGAAAIGLQMVPYRTVNDGLTLLGAGQVDLLLPDPRDGAWLDGVVGADTVTLNHPDPVVLVVNRASGITSLSNLGGSRLGVTSGAKVEASLRHQLLSGGTQATISRYQSFEQAAQAMAIGQLDGLVLKGGDASALRLKLANRGLNADLLAEPLMQAGVQVLLPLNQSDLRDALLVAAKELQGAAQG
jgi:ABC-type amino acid transport substrate-binding protein